MRADDVLADVSLGASVARENMVYVLVEWPNLPAHICELLIEAIDELEAMATVLDSFIGSGEQRVH